MDDLYTLLDLYILLHLLLNSSDFLNKKDPISKRNALLSVSPPVHSDYRKTSCIHFTTVIELLSDLTALRNAGAPFIPQLGDRRIHKTIHS